LLELLEDGLGNGKYLLVLLNDTDVELEDELLVLLLLLDVELEDDEPSSSSIKSILSR
jgi:hypothetical protein